MSENNRCIQNSINKDVHLQFGRTSHVIKTMQTFTKKLTLYLILMSIVLVESVNNSSVTNDTAGIKSPPKLITNEPKVKLIEGKLHLKLS